MKTENLNDQEKAIIKAIEIGYEMLVLVVPMHAKINDFAAADALASLKKRGIVAFDGRDKFNSVYLTPEFETLGADGVAELVA